MDQRSFNVLYKGQLLSGFEFDVVKTQMAKQFNLADSRIEALFSGRLITIKKNLSEPDAQRYLDAFAGLGAKALLSEVVEREIAAELPTSNVDRGSSKNAGAQITSAVASQRADNIDCPRCNHQQSADFTSCAYCNMDLRRHLLKREKRQRSYMKAETE